MKRLMSFYGDDFTGSTDAMESLASHGIKTVLFTRLPNESEFAQFSDYAAVGLAGTSRSQSPDWMDEQLPPVFQWLRDLDARICHYKICSTFDSSPTAGNIGRATEIAARIFGQRLVPLVVGVPQLKRYTFAGHLFAAFQGQVYRIDRHPVMSRHPVTPMDESDLRLHLSRQTALPVNLVADDWPQTGIVLLDVHDLETQQRTGKLLLDLPAHAAPFVVGSSGVGYAVMKALAAAGEISGKASFPQLEPVSQTIVVSGSVSPTTERQIHTALGGGFDAVPVSVIDLARRESGAIQGATSRALRCLSDGRSPLIYSALGSATDQSQELSAIPGGRRNIGESLGRILRSVIETTGLRRAIIAGGDSSSHALGQLDIFAMTTRYPLSATPGSPLCTAYSGDPRLNGLDIAMKGGQLGGDRYFIELRDGSVQAANPLSGDAAAIHAIATTTTG